MDSEGIRANLEELRAQAQALLKRLGAAEGGSGAEAWVLLDRFTSVVDGMITRSEESGARVFLERFFDVLPPEGAKVEFDRFKEMLSGRFQSSESLSDIAGLYELFIRLVDKPDLDLSQEEFDSIDNFFGMRLTRPLYQGKYSFAAAVSLEGEGRTLQEEPQSVPAEETASGIEVSAALEGEVSAPRDGSLPEAIEPETTEPEATEPEIIEPDIPDIQEILPHFEISTPKSESSFSVKTFTNDYFLTSKSGIVVPKINRRWEIRLICWFVDIGAVSKSQVEQYLFDEHIGDKQLERLCKDGYVSAIKHKESGVEFYALSSKGTEIFKRTGRNPMKCIIDPLPSSPLNYASELAQIDADIDAYQRTAAVALHLYDNVVVTRVERIHIDVKIPVVLLMLWDNGITNYLAVVGVPKKVLLLPLLRADFPESRSEQDVCLRRLVRSACTDADGCKQHYCTVSDDYTTVSCFDPEGNAFDVDDYIESHVRPTLKIKSDDPSLNTPDPREFVDIIEWLTPENSDAFEHREFIGRLRQFTPADDKSIGFKVFVEALKRIPPKSDKLILFKKLVEGLKPKITRDGDGKNIGLEDFIESFKILKVSMKVTVTGDSNGEAGSAEKDLNPADEPSRSDVVDEAPSTPFLMARHILDKKGVTAADNKEMFDNVVSLLLCADVDAAPDEKTDYIGRAAVLRKSLSLADEKIYGADYRRLLLATDMPLDVRDYSMEGLSTAFSGDSEGTAFHLAALLRALFLPASRYDEYALAEYARDRFKRYDRVFGAYLGFKSMLGVFIEIGGVAVDGFTDEVVSLFTDEDTNNQFIKELRSDAAKLCQIPHINQRFNGVPEMLEMCFGQNSELGLCMSYISENRESNREIVSKGYESFVEGGKASPQKINKFIDECWKEVRHSSKKWIRNDDILSTARQKIDYAIRQRLDIMNRWLAYTESPSNGPDDSLSEMYSKTKKSLESAIECLREDTSLPKPDRAVLSRAVKNMSMRLSGKHPLSFLPADWLSTGIFAVSGGLPAINDDYEDIPDYEHWRNALRHIAEEPARDLRDVLTKIENVEDPLYDNLGQAIAICEYLGIDETRYQNSVMNAREAAEKHLIREFEERMCLDVAYSRINGKSKEVAIADLGRKRPEFFERNDFAELRRFLMSLRERLNDDIADKLKYWMSVIIERQSGGSPDKYKYLGRTVKELKKGSSANFVLVEELINLFDAKSDQGHGDLDLGEKDVFLEFIGVKNYKALESICNKNKSLPFRTFSEKIVKERIKESGSHKNSALRLVQSFPGSHEKTGCEETSAMLTELGFVVSTIKRDNPNRSPAVFTVKTASDRKNAESYRHPIADMGTAMGDTLRVVALFDSMEPRFIIAAAQESGLSGMPIVFLNGYLTLAQRRQLAMLFLKDGDARAPFVLVDWILMLHIAQKHKEDRLRVMLACAMPYTGCRQFFSANIPVAEEMYVGRAEEIRQIIDKNGPVFVYGGPQIGKTAMLLRTKNIFHAPKNGDYCVYADVKDCRDEKSFIAAVTDKMREAELGFAPAKTTTKELCDGIREWLLDVNNKRLLLLMDGSDAIFSVFAQDGYSALSEFERVSKENRRFKFVFAGLHNVCSAAKDTNAAFERFGKPICLRPMSHSDAYKLLAKPLRYLGFDTGADTLLPLLANTNFYPGVVQFVGAELVKILIRNYSKYYNESDNPPYRLTEEQIGSIMLSVGLSEMIDDRIKGALGGDPRYLTLARCVAMLCYEEEQSQRLGYEADKIWEYAKTYGMDIMQNETQERCESLLSEMSDMSVLVNKDGRYRFRQSRFLNIIGKDTNDILDQMAIANEVT